MHADDFIDVCQERQRDLVTGIRVQRIYRFFTIDAGHPARYRIWSLTYRLRTNRMTVLS